MADAAPAETPKRRDQDAADTTPVARPRHNRRDTMRYRLRKQTRPHLILAELWVAGAGGYIVAGAAGDSAPVVATVAAVTLSALAARWLLLRRQRRRIGSREVLAALAGAGWLCWVIANGPDWTASTVLLAGGYAAALRWWRRWRIPNPPDDPQAPDSPDAAHPPRLWGEHVAAAGGPLPGSHLHSEEAIATGLRYLAQLVPGQQTLGRAQGMLPQLRTGLRLRPRQDLVLEQHPDTDESVISVTIVRQSHVLTAGVPWPRPTYDPAAGTIALGPYVDGEGVAEWLLHSDNGLWGGFLAGSTGSGKSRMLDSIALATAAAGAVVWYGDPQGGASSPFLTRHADHTAGSVDAIRTMLEQARRVKQLRQAENALNGWEGWTPEQSRPALVIIVDESHSALADKACQAIATEIAREGRKVGVVLILASQVATLDAFGSGAGADALRSSVCSGNVVILRSKTRNTRNVLPGVDIDPTAFPRVPGYAYLIDDTGTRRTAPLRGYWLDDHARDQWGQTITWPALDESSAGAAGDGYRNRHAQAATEREALVEWVEALRTGCMPAGATSAAPAASTSTRPWRVIPFPRWSEWQAAARTLAPTAPRTSVEVVAELVACGVSSPSEIERRAGYSETAVRNALRQLASAGRVRRDRHGVWSPTSTHQSTAGPNR